MKNHTKRYIFLLLLIFVTCSLCINAFAAETTIVTTVPSHAVVEVIIFGKGSVEIDGKTYSENTFVEVERQKETSYLITPADGYAVNNIVYNGNDVTDELVNNTYTAAQVDVSGVLTVTFVSLSGTPSTGDSDAICIMACIVLASFVACAILIKVRRNA